MNKINSKYEGSSGQSITNPIQGFTEGRKDNKESAFGRFIDKFGSSLKDLFVEKVSIEEYTKALLDLI